MMKSVSLLSGGRMLLCATAFALSSMVIAAPTVTMKTNLGTIEIELDQARAPKTVANFLEYVQAGHYNGTIFHRVIDGFMVQGGGFLPDMQEKPTRNPIPNEADNGLKNTVYTIAMARTQEPHSATSQFFINTQNNSFLDYRAPTLRGYGYAVFGRVTSGIDVVNKISRVKTQRHGLHDDVPVTPVLIESVKIKGN